MARALLALSLLAALPLQVLADFQNPLLVKKVDLHEESGPKLHGRFLHITDIHPDSYYKPNSETDSDHICHRGSGDATPYGAAGTDCDAPISLVNATFAWIRDNLADSVDFVVWTGDSSRHDNDDKNPRTEKEILEMNQFLSDQLSDIFSKSDDKGKGKGLRVPIIPTIGNNDIMPHNIFKRGPNRWTKRFVNIWNKFIPESQRHSFVEGGWFYVEVIPDKLVVFSLNTMYFFDSNNAVDGCEDKSEPGYEHMEWLRIQLQFIRKRNMKAILIGHVPPARAGSKQNWDETCWQKYTLWLRQYRDVIVGSVYGHMNIDHFMFHDSDDLEIGGKESDSLNNPIKGHPDDEVSTRSRLGYLSSLRKEWSKLPSPPDTASYSNPEDEDEDYFDPDSHLLGTRLNIKKKKTRKQYLKEIGGPWGERYSVSFVSPSVIPNYYPSLRVIEYNTSGLGSAMLWSEVDPNHEPPNLRAPPLDTVLDKPKSPSSEKKKKKKKKKKHKKPKFEVPKPPSPTAPPGPAYSNQPLTWLSYTQYFTNLTKFETKDQSLKQSSISWREYRLEKASDSRPDGNSAPLHFEVEYDTRTDKQYKLKDLTIRSLLHLARRIAAKEPHKNEKSSPLDADTVCESGEVAPPSEIPSRSVDKKDYPPDAPCTREESRVSATKSKKNVWIIFLRRAFVGFFDDDHLDDAS
ncbi:Acid sphingomyelinase-like phosphodiesterase 3b [Emmonsiellopsis sp. PD_33]|nr:Acid sphingomyelinase-like phosphodiesterase 3b [Emmonsiellopsis sp. PD_33]